VSTIYDVLVRPLMTEKSSYQSSKLKKYSFVVKDDATRTMVKEVETLFDVAWRASTSYPPRQRDAVPVATAARRRAAYKKAIITLAEGSKPSRSSKGAVMAVRSTSPSLPAGGMTSYV
jgi:large subunit ribosomal protein L23